MKEVEPTEAHRLMQEEGYSYLDVRTETEFKNGHPEGAVNAPAFQKTPAGMAPNPDFVTTVEKHLPKDANIVVGCLAGGRSAKAIQMLEANGYTNLVNCCGGFGGGQDRATGQPVSGWKDRDLPVDDSGKILT